MEAPSGFEPEMEVLQTSALPLGYGARPALATGFRGGKLERETGFEPATSTLARSHSTTELFPPDRSLTYHTDAEFIKCADATTCTAGFRKRPGYFFRARLLKDPDLTSTPVFRAEAATSRSQTPPG